MPWLKLNHVSKGGNYCSTFIILRVYISQTINDFWWGVMNLIYFWHDICIVRRVWVYTAKYIHHTCWWLLFYAILRCNYMVSMQNTSGHDIRHALQHTVDLKRLPWSNVLTCYSSDNFRKITRLLCQMGYGETKNVQHICLKFSHVVSVGYGSTTIIHSFILISFQFNFVATYPSLRI